MKLNVRALTLRLAVVVLSAIGSFETQAATVAEIATCRETVTDASSRHATQIVSLVASCHDARLKGRVADTTDCNHLPTAAAALGKTIEASLFAADLGASGEDCEGVSTAEASYTSCPAPCDGTEITDWPSVDTCMRCLLESHVGSFAAAALGQAILPLERDTQRCAKAVLRLFSKVTATWLKENARCLEDLGRPNGCIDLNAGGRTRVARARGKAAARLSKSCVNVDHPALGGCATGLADLGCIMAEVDRHVPVLSYDVARMLGELQPEAETFSSVSQGQLLRCGVLTNGLPSCWSSFYSVARVPQGGFTQLAVLGGSWGVCGLRPDGSIDCWTTNSECCGHPPILDPPLGTFDQLSASERFACGIRTDDSLACWGENTNGWLDAPSGAFTSLSVGLRHACAIRTDGTAECWGDDEVGQATAPSGTFLQVSAGYKYSCGIRSDQTIECWGDTEGDATPIVGTFTRIDVASGMGCGVRTDASLECWTVMPVWSPDSTAGTFTDVEIDPEGVCALRTDGSMRCWSTRGDFEKPDPSDSYENISTYSHSCAVRTDGSLHCWGFNTDGQVVSMPGDFTHVSAGSRHTCALHDDQTIQCWGHDSYGQSTPPPGDFMQVSVGQDHSCAIAADLTATCWGIIESPPAGAFTSISASGAGAACGVRPDSSLECWGDNYWGQTSAPTFNYHSVSLGWRHGCGVTVSAGLVCWGNNEQGQASPPSAGGPYESVASGSAYSCGLRSGGTLDCWPYGRPLPPPGVFSSVSVGEQACAIRNDGRLVCW